MKFKIGDFISDGFKTYVLDRDKEWHYVDSGSHADYIISHQNLLEIVGKNVVNN